MVFLPAKDTTQSLYCAWVLIRSFLAKHLWTGCLYNHNSTKRDLVVNVVKYVVKYVIKD